MISLVVSAIKLSSSKCRYCKHLCRIDRPSKLVISDLGIWIFTSVGVLNKYCEESQRFNEMKSKTTEIMLALPGTLLFLFIFLPFFFIWIPYKFLSSFNYIFLFDIGVFRYCGWIPIVLGVVIYFWCSLMFLFIGKGTPLFLPPNKKLVLKGLYRYVRNPMYIGAMLITLGEGLLFQSISLFIYALAVFGVCNFNILILEEPYLANKFGESYAQYRKSVRRWIPRLTPYKENDSVP